MSDYVLGIIVGLVIGLCGPLIAAELSPVACKYIIAHFERIECERPAQVPQQTATPTPLPVEAE